MRLPFISSYPGKSPRAVATFKGINENLVISPSEFSAMKNMSCRDYPAISSRLPRGTAVYTPGGTLQGLFWKNGLFYIRSNKCYYNGSEITGGTVTGGQKQLVGMGAYIVIFPDKKMYNTSTGEWSALTSEMTVSSATIAEQSIDSTYAKITVSGIGSKFKQGDTVIITGIDDISFKVDGTAEIGKTITEIGSNYIVVTASIQSSFSKAITMSSASDVLRIAGEGIGNAFKVGDVIKVIGTNDDALNMTGLTVTAKATNYLTIGGSTFPAKAVTQSASLLFQYYYKGSDLTKISGADVNDFSEGDVVRIRGCSKSAYNKDFLVKQAGLNYILVETTLDESFTQASGITITRLRHEAELAVIKRTSFTAANFTISRRVKDMDFVCEHDNRIWGCSSANHEIYACKLGDPTNWDTYEGISTDSYTATVGSDGDFTGIASHLGYVLFFKEQTIHIMYGSKPANFQLNSKNLPGVRSGCSRSLQNINDTLFYVGREGVYAYDGAVPMKISQNIVEEITDAAAGQYEGRYYLSCMKGGTRTLLCYDHKYQIWDVEDNTKFTHVACGGGLLYYAADNGTIYTIAGTRSDTINWMIESGDLSESSLDEKYISKAQFNLRLDPGAEANIFFRYDDDPLWHRKGTIAAIKPTTYTLPIIAQRCNKFRWKIEGKGGMKLLAMGIMVEGGSELHGNVQSWRRR